MAGQSVEVVSITMGAFASLFGALIGGRAALLAVRQEARHATELATHERSSAAATSLLSAVGDYRLAISRESVGYRSTQGWPIDRSVLGRLAIVCDTQGEALADLQLRFMTRRTLQLATSYIDSRNADHFEWTELERIQEQAMEYLVHSLGRHIRRQPIVAWQIMPLHDLEELMVWSPPDHAPDQAPNTHTRRRFVRMRPPSW